MNIDGRKKKSLASFVFSFFTAMDKIPFRRFLEKESQRPKPKTKYQQTKQVKAGDENNRAEAL
jgi:hypothetical protein